MIKVKNDIRYGDKAELTLDMYEPDDRPIVGTVIDIHGGGWFRGDKKTETDLGHFLGEEGYLVVAPNYRIGPDNTYPAPLEDMDQLMNWLTKQGLSDNVAVLGSSAGGNMSVEMGIKYGFPAISLSGILDFDEWLQLHQSVVAAQNQTQDLDELQKTAGINQDGANDPFYKWFSLNYLNGDLSLASIATPYHKITEKTGPVFLANSLNEFVPNSGVLKFAERLTQLNVPVTTRFMVGSEHAKGYLEAVKPDIVNFLADNLKK
ncbi:alpha/beta hydrolase [Dellaglioa sp. L3N]